MDSLTTLLRRYHKTHCEADHSKLITEALRQDRLSYDDIAIMAVLGHQPCQFVLADCHRPTCFIFHDRVIKTMEPKDIVQELKRWGAKATISAACGVLRTNKNPSKSYNELLSLVEDNVHSYERKTHPYKPRKPLNPLSTLMRSGVTLITIDTLGEANRVYGIAIRELKSDLSQNFNYPGLHPLIILNGTLDDATIMSGMRNGLIDKALGEFA